LNSSWLDLLIQSTRNLEPPERFFWWSGIALISSLVKKRLFLNRFSYNLYPNVYVLLVSERSGLRKGVPILMMRQIAEILKVRTISGRNSIQGVIKELASQVTHPNGKVENLAQAFLCAPELTSFVVHDPEGLNILLDLHNTHEHLISWKNTLKSSPIEELKEPCITFLGAINEPLFIDFFKKKDIEGGLIGRMFIVHESKKRSVQDLMEEPEGFIPGKDLADKLLYLQDIKGEFYIDSSGKRFYKNWYHYLNELNLDDRTGAIERLGDQVLKVAMIISLSESPNLVITEEHLKQSVSKCEDCIVGTKRVTLSSGRSEFAPGISTLMKILVESEEGISRRKLQQKMWPDYDSMSLDRIIDTVLSSGALEQPFRRGKEIIYKMKKEHIEAYLNFRKEVN